MFTLRKNLSASGGNDRYEKINTEKYVAEYSEEKLWQKLAKHFKSIGVQAAYKVLQLFYVTKNPKCPKKVKAGIYGALGYFVMPFDAIADFIPVVGYTDDLTVIGAALIMAQLYINDEVRSKAKQKLSWIFGPETISKLK